MKLIRLLLVLTFFSCQYPSNKKTNPNKQMEANKIEELKRKYSKEYDLLQNPKTWCDGAEELVKSGDQLTILLLVEAYLLPIEMSKQCLLDNMEKIGGSGTASTLWEEGDAEVKRLVLHLMRLFPSDTFLDLLNLALKENNGIEQKLVLRTLINQNRNQDWEEIMLGNLEIVDEELNKIIITELKKSKSQKVIEVLKQQNQ